ncbi:hypothetical protein LIN78_16810 [Leeia sp. TBRC 13508]|uniref:Uncharacterized protein n=1 Tax=Leeia speluncae TaxID=2884804 RepID=A0ABS8DAM1_9NEIS|nr:hypothetical protein [Leeia speluncae]MCB6185209.1 hypothetical protein [Leeia speluncae]
MVISGRIKAPFKIAFRTWELSLILLLVGCLTAEPGDYFKADLATRFAFFGCHYLVATAVFAWTTARLFQLSGYPIPFILCYCFLTLLAIPEVLLPVFDAISTPLASGVSLFWFAFSLYAFSRAIRRLIPIPKRRLVLIIAFGFLFSIIINVLALQIAASNHWVDPTSIFRT